jgi:putative tryptophan/tyrosine transport system substrate-binding protein
MQRREFIAALGSAAAWPLASRAQQTDRMRRIGALIGGAESEAYRQANVEEFRKALQELGWIEGRNIRIDLRWAAGDFDRARSFSAELIGLQPDVLFGDNTFVVAALQQATHTVPIVFAFVNNPIGSGFVSSLARPGGNITGFADSDPQSLTKLVEFTKEIAPQITRVAIITRPTPRAAGQVRTRHVETAASLIGLKPTVATVRDTGEIEDAIDRFAREPNGGLIVPGDPFTNIHHKLIIALAARHKLPATYGYSQFVRDGGLLSYGTKTSEQYRGAAGYVHRMLKGEKPSDLPVQQPTRFELAINIKTAKSLGLAVPLTLQAAADEVIE